MKRNKIYLMLLFLLSTFSACSDSSGESNTSTTTPSSIDTSAYSVSVAGTSSSYSTADIAGNTEFSYTIYIDFTANTAKLPTGTEQALSTTAVTVITVDSTYITVSKASTGVVTIASTVASPVKYVLSGTLAGTLQVLSSSASYQLYLNGVTINGSTIGPAIDLETTQKVFIVTADGTTNTLTDTATRSTITKKAALYGTGTMIFSGSGSLAVNANYKHGIFSNDYIRICEGNISVTDTAKDAIRTVNGFIFDDGTLTINATGTTTDDESKGIKVEGVESSTGVGKGYVVINGGNITITSVSKGITASFDTTEDGDTASTTYDPNPDVTINNGVITVTTTGTVYEYTSGNTTVSCSPEGIEGKSDLTINSGYITISTADDCLNAGSSVTINGGYIYAASSDNDAIDSNGTLTITGGVIVAGGSEVPEEAFDCDTNTFTITGGTFVGVAGATSTPTSSVCTQNAVILGSGTKNTTMALIAGDGTVAFAFTIPQSYSTMLLSSAEIKTGTKYTIYKGGTASGGSSFNGLYLGTKSYSGGTAGSSFTVSSKVTNLPTTSI